MEGPERSTEHRLAQLEREVAELRHALRSALQRPGGVGAAGVGGANVGADRSGGPTEPGRGPGAERAPNVSSGGTAGAGDEAKPPPKSVRDVYAYARAPWFDPSKLRDNAESWLPMAGVGLVGLGVLLLFKYAIDQGWITPTMRCLLGLLAGFAMYVAAVRVQERHRVWSQVVMGGGLGVLYVTVWAASVLYALIPVGFGFIGLGLVSGETVRRGDSADTASLAVIGTMFGFAAPILLSDVGLTAPLVVLTYSIVLAAGCALVYARRGWLLVVGVAALGAFILLAQLGDPPPALRIQAQVTLVLLWALVAITPLVFEPPAGRSVGGLPGPAAAATRWAARAFALRAIVLGSTLAAIARTSDMWGLTEKPAALLLAAAGATFAVVAWVVRERQSYHAAVEAAALFFMVAAAIGLEDGWRLAAEAGIVTAAAWVAMRTSADGLLFIVHFTYLILGTVLMRRFGSDPTFGSAAGALAILASAALVARWLPRTLDRVYTLAAYALFLYWLLWVLSPMPQGALLGSAAWGAIGTGLVIAGVALDRASLDRLGLATLAATAAKMLLVDLAQAETLWRIGLFIGFGSVLLALGYFLRERRARQPSA